MIIYSTSMYNTLYIHKNKIYVKYTQTIDDIDLLEIILYRHLNYPTHKLIPTYTLLFKEDCFICNHDSFIKMLIENKMKRIKYKLTGFIAYYPLTYLFLSLFLIYIIFICF